MDAPPLSPARSQELADLRRRAYGPEADIQRDPVAQRRLYELELLARPVATESAHERDVDQADPLTSRPVRDEASEALESTAPGLPVAAEEPAMEAPPAAPAARPLWRRIPLWTIGAVVGVGIGLALGLSWPTSSEPPPDLTLDVEPGAGERGAGFRENLDYWGVDPSTVVPHESFDAIQVWTARAVDESRCLLLSFDGGFLSATCSGAGLDPVLDFTVYDGMSLELETPLPIGTVIRFVGRQGHVDVWVSVPGGQ